MAKIIAIANQKGGVGKTTTCVNLVASLAYKGKHVLLVDLDPQGNATMGSGSEKSQLAQSAHEMLMGEITAEQALVVTDFPGFHLIPSNEDLTASETSLLKMDNREFRLKNVLEPLREKYDYILIDCPPTLNALTINALVAAEGVIIPMQCEYYALEGLSALLKTISQIRTVNPDLTITGVVRTMYDGRNRLALDVSQQLQHHFGEKLYETVIPRNVRLAEAPSFGKPAVHYDPRSLGAKAYLELADEVLAGLGDCAVEQETAQTETILA